MNRLTTTTKSNWLAIVKAASRSEWYRVAELLESSKSYKSKPVSFFASYVSRKLAKEANWHAKNADFRSAWDHIQKAADIAPGNLSGWIREQKNEIIELAIHHADSALTAGQADVALTIIRELSEQRILDWRADRITAAAQMIHQADQLMTRGKFEDALEKLAIVSRQRPDLYYLDERIELTEKRKIEFDSLVRDLNYSLAKKDSGRIVQLAQDIRRMAPKAPQVASGRLNVESLTTWIGESTSGDYSEEVAGQNGGHERPAKSIRRADDGRLGKNIMLWIDGAGGFLVCLGPTISIGRYVEHANVDIALKSDLQRRHALVASSPKGFELSTQGDTQVNGKKCEGSRPLVHNDLVSLNKNVDLRFIQPDNRSTSARLEFVSGHRTVPWCDAILLLNDHITIGPYPRNHVFFRSLKSEMKIFLRDGQLSIDASGVRLHVDGRVSKSTMPLRPDSRITTDQISIQLESLNVPSL